MAHFAKIENGIVVQVIVADQEFIESGALGDKNDWVQTSYNTVGGVHTNGGIPLRKNFAGVGYMYDSEKDAFIPPKPFLSWILNEETCLWHPPVAYPNDLENNYKWDESTLSWTIITE